MIDLTYQFDFVTVGFFCPGGIRSSGLSGKADGFAAKRASHNLANFPYRASLRPSTSEPVIAIVTISPPFDIV